jgi:hypothetical protein
MKRTRSFIPEFAVAMLATGALAEEPKAPAVVQRMHQAERIRIFYHTEGQHAVDLADANASGVPDQVEDIMAQTQAARILFVEGLGFPDPFATERFRSASFLDIHLRHKDVLKSNGITYDELQRFKRSGDPEGTVTLCFNVATSVKASANLTPAHEFFHLIQNSVCYFKNRWYTEGTARWSERALGTGVLGPQRLFGAWPLPEEKAASLSTMAYEAAEHFWNPLCAKLDSKGIIPESPALERVKAMTYADGTTVLKDLRLTGWEFIRDVLAGLERADDAAFRELGYDRWSEENQKSPKNDAYILRVVEDAVKARQ